MAVANVDVDLPDLDDNNWHSNRPSGGNDQSDDGCRCRRCVEHNKLNVVESRLKRNIRRGFFIALAIGWLIIIGHMIYNYHWGHSLSERVEILADNPKVQLPGTPAWYSQAVRSLGEKTGWTSNQGFIAWYNAHPERVHETYASFYARRGMAHPRMYERGGRPLPDAPNVP